KINDEWNKEFEGLGISIFNDIKPTSDGYIIAGETAVPGIVEYQGWLVKIDKDGNEIWEKYYGSGFLSTVLEIEDGYIAIGKTSFDGWLLKVDKEGNEIWNKSFGWKKDDYFNNGIKTKDGGYLMVGVTHCIENITFPYGDVLVLKTDKEGNLEWYNHFDGNNDGDIGYDVIEIDDGYLISGSTVISISERWDAWLIKIDKKGNEIWNKTYGWSGGRYLVLHSYIKEIEDGDIIIAGDVCVPPADTNRAYLIKLDKEGNEIWKKIYGEGTYEMRAGQWIEGFEITKDGFILYGFTFDYSIGNWDGWLLKVDKEGNELWNKSFGRRWEEKIEGVVVLEDGYICVGKTEHKWGYGLGWILKCNDLPPPKMKIIKPKENCLYIFDREIVPYDRTLIIGAITITVEVDKPEKINRVEFYLDHYNQFDNIPEKIDYSPPYEWKCRAIGFGLLPCHLAVGVYYGNSGAVAAGRMVIYIINLVP
ncbi:MAG: hypothetical protein QW673_01560, partial [Candidatus Thermoplasmatota archaeon]